MFQSRHWAFTCLRGFLGLVQTDFSRPGIQSSIQDSLIPVAHDGNLHRLTLEGPSSPPGWRFGNNGGIGEKHHRPLPALQAAL
jgi:hypothetical protein